jgi:xanthine dehydrogenase YagR molybdenum-binding subunit
MEILRVNQSCAGSVRKPGEAVATGIDLVELSKRNIPETLAGEGKPFSSHELPEALDDGAAAFGWADLRMEQADGEWMIGYGMQSVARVNMIGESHARVTLNPDGTLLIETDMTDIGTSTYAILTQIVGEMLDLLQDRIEARLGYRKLPPSAGSGGSWGASSAGSSVFLACEKVAPDHCGQAGLRRRRSDAEGGHRDGGEQADCADRSGG